ncbi:MAG: hypothetical protein IPP15_13060 [Saprospiraceae bacterium]|uniref:DUF4251 domain-containing protein n=1 Tax=Candidatus Opimibacter skivensis TaxID=2982028 RepID=A0A9D7XNF3_9BACT|nr:hypothetical protein [Candidatus Opimibacter skivensis]
MKNFILFLVALVVTVQMTAQSQAETFIKEAQAYLAQKDYKQAQLSLQDAINDINNVLAQQISQSFPAEINGLKANEDNGNSTNTATMGMMGGGMTISKTYQHPTKKENSAEINIIANSPMMSMMSMYMNNPAVMGQGYKSIRVGTRRGILKSEMQDSYGDNGNSKQIRSTELQIPLTQTLITINLKGFATEADELAFAAKLDIEKLRVSLGE